MADEIIKVLDNLAQRMGVVIDWSSENVLPYMMELGDKLITYKITLSVLILILVVVGDYACYRALKWSTEPIKVEVNRWGNLYEKTTTRFDEADFLPVFLVILAIVFLIFSIPLFIVNATSLIKCLTIPELVIIEYLQGLM